MLFALNLVSLSAVSEAHSHGHSHSHSAIEETGFGPHNGLTSSFLYQMFPFESAGYNAFLATLYVSVIPYMLVFAIPGLSSGSVGMVRVMVPFALGGILGDVFLHVLPELYNEGNDPAEVGYGILSGFLLFMAIDKLLRVLNMGTDKGGLHSHGHGHSHSQEHGEKNGGSRSLRAAAYLNVISEFLHKGTDGLALASAFYASQYVGIMSFVAILLHEAPHELGDFAVKLSGGLTYQQAIKSEMVANMGTVAGTAVGCLLNDWGASSAETVSPTTTMIMTVTCGGFIYTSTVGIVPELLHMHTDSKQHELQTTAVQILSALSGFYMMRVLSF